MVRCRSRIGPMGQGRAVSRYDTTHFRKRREEGRCTTNGCQGQPTVNPHTNRLFYHCRACLVKRGAKQLARKLAALKKAA